MTTSSIIRCGAVALSKGGKMEKSNQAKIKAKLRGVDPKWRKPKGHKQKSFDAKALRSFMKKEYIDGKS